MENFWKAADDPEGSIDKLAEIVNYINNDKSGAIDMADDIQTNADAIDVIEGNDAGKSMRQVATAVVEGLDATVTKTAGNDGLALEVVQENGVLKSVTGSIAANTYDAHGAAALVQGNTTKTVKDIEDAAATA